MHIRRKDKIPTDYTFLRDKMRAPYFWINHLTGAAIGIIGFLPSSAILTSMTTAVSTTNYQMNTSSKKSLVAFNRDMLNLGQAFGYWDNPVDLIDSIYGAYQLEKDNNFSNLFDVFKESFELNNIEASGTVDQYKTALQDKILDISNGYQITWNGGIASSTNNRTALQCCSINLRVNNLVVNYIKDKLIDDTVDISSKAIDNVLDFFSKLFSGLPNQSFEVHFDGDTFPDGTDVTINFNGIYLLKVQISNDFYSGLVDVINKDFFGNKFTTQYPNPGKTFIDYFFYPGLKNTNIY
jgi:hypothetical protein